MDADGIEIINGIARTHARTATPVQFETCCLRKKKRGDGVLTY